jgi:hypothetical protein
VFHVKQGPSSTPISAVVSRETEPAGIDRLQPIWGATSLPGSARVSLVPDTPASLPDFTRWPSFPFEGDIRVKALDDPVDVEPPRKGEDPADCTACGASDDAYIWVSDRWRVRAMDRPTGLPMVLILESRSHLDLGDLPNMLAAELGVMTVRLERAIRSLDDVARVHVNRWGDGEAHLHLWFMGRPQGRLQLRGTFLSLWDEILPSVSEAKWRENLALVAAWLAEFGGTPLAEPPRIDWKAPAKLASATALVAPAEEAGRLTEDDGELVEERDRLADEHDGLVSEGDRVGDAEGGSAAGAQAQAQAQATADDGDSVPVTAPQVAPVQASTPPAESAESGAADPLDEEPSTGLRHPVPGASRS